MVKRKGARIRTTRDAKTTTLEYVGPYDGLVAASPEPGDRIAGYAGEVEEVNVYNGTSSDGRMEVVIIDSTAPEDPDEPGGEPGGGGDQPDEIQNDVYTLGWGEERRRVEEHPKCGELKADRPKYEESGGKWTEDESGSQRTWDDWQSLDEDDYEPVSGGWSLATYKQVKEKGYTDYPVHFPIATATTYHRSRPSGGSGVGQLSSPPGECGAPTQGWTYVKSADDVRKEGTSYTRVQEWRGYDRTEDLFYTQ